MIITPEQYKAAMKKIPDLWDAKPGTKEYDDFEELCHQIDEYERKNFPIGKPYLKEKIRFRIEQQFGYSHILTRIYNFLIK